jgi:hypothetical protein
LPQIAPPCSRWQQPELTNARLRGIGVKLKGFDCSHQDRRHQDHRGAAQRLIIGGLRERYDLHDLANKGCAYEPEPIGARSFHHPAAAVQEITLRVGTAILSNFGAIVCVLSKGE